MRKRLEAEPYKLKQTLVLTTASYDNHTKHIVNYNNK